MDKKIENLPEAIFPPGLHGKIMRRVIFLRFRMPFLTTLGVLLLNIAISGWRFWTAANENQVLAILQSLMGGFEMSASFAGDLLRTIYESVPVWSLSILLINAFLAGYVAWIYVSFRRMSPLAR